MCESRSINAQCRQWELVSLLLHCPKGKGRSVETLKVVDGGKHAFRCFLCILLDSIFLELSRSEVRIQYLNASSVAFTSCLLHSSEFSGDMRTLRIGAEKRNSFKISFLPREVARIKPDKVFVQRMLSQ